MIGRDTVDGHKRRPAEDQGHWQSLEPRTELEAAKLVDITPIAGKLVVPS